MPYKGRHCRSYGKDCFLFIFEIEQRRPIDMSLSESTRSFQESFAPKLRSFIKQFFLLVPHAPGIAKAQLVSGIVSSLTLIAAVIAFGPTLGPTALFGSMIAQWEADRPFLARIRCALLIGGIMTVTMGIGVLIAPYHAAIVPIVVVLILLMTTGYYSFVLTRGPGPLNLFYATAIGSYLGQFSDIGLQTTYITGYAAAFAGALTLVALLPNMHGPEERAVQNAEQEVEAFCLHSHANLSLHERSARRHTAYAAVNRGWLTLRAAGNGILGCQAKHINRMLASNRALSLQITTNAYPHIRPEEVGTSTPALRGRPTLFWLFQNNFHKNSVAWFTAFRVGLAAAISGGLTQFLNLGHPYWAILTSTLILHRWIGRLATTTRALHRGVGTLLGLGVVSGVLSLQPGRWGIIAAIVVCILVQNLLVLRNYALGIVFVTPMALLSIEAAGQTGWSLERLMTDRIDETLVGITVAILVTWTTTLRKPREMMRAQFQRTLQAIEHLLRFIAQDLASSPEAIHARVVLQYELLTTLAVLTQAAEDDPELHPWHDVEVAMADLGYATLAACWLNQPSHLVSALPTLRKVTALRKKELFATEKDTHIQCIAQHVVAINRTLSEPVMGFAQERP